MSTAYSPPVTASQPRLLIKLCMASTLLLVVGFLVMNVKVSSRVGATTGSQGTGYWMLDSSGTVYSLGDATSMCPGSTTCPVSGITSAVAMAPTPDGGGYWVVSPQGVVVGSGDAKAFSLSTPTSAPVVAIASTSDGQGYWLTTNLGQIITAGDAVSFGEDPANLASPIVDMVATPDAKGYWMLGGDGGVFAFGDAGFFGSTGAIHLNRPAVAMASSPDGRGYWFVASDGGVFAFGDAGFFGSMASTSLARPVLGIVSTINGDGYWMVASDGGVFAFGDAGFVGSLGGQAIAYPIVAFAPYEGAPSNVPSTLPSGGTTTSSLGPPTSIVVSDGTGWSSTGLDGPQPSPGSCHYGLASDGYDLPDLSCTPGGINSNVTQSNIGSTICSSGYTTSVRPPESMTEPVKFILMDAYNDPNSASTTELDHLVPLELGGSSATQNLWAQPDQGQPSEFDPGDPYGINAKDGVEDALHDAVCAGKVTLASAQQAIVANWTTALDVLGLSSPTSTATSSPVSTTTQASVAPWCQASAAPANDGYSGDFNVTVTSNQPYQNATASDTGDSWSQETNGSGSVVILLYNSSPGELINVTVGSASCSATA